MKNLALTILFALFVTLFVGCDDDDASSSNNGTVNKWIYKEMKTYYYWEDHIPTKVNYNSKPEDFFSSILYKEEDRFSWIENITELENKLNGISVAPGFEMQLYQMYSDSRKIYGQVIYVTKDGPAYPAGLKRGDLFTTVNGTTLTMDNYSALLFGESTVMKLGIVDENYIHQRDITVTLKQFAESPIILDTIYSIDNHKIGYFAYKNFIKDPGDGSDIYDNQINDIFGSFKASGIDELILDFRFNTGGSELSAAKLASLIVKNATSSDVFAYHDYNDAVTKYLNDENQSDSFTLRFIDEPNNVSTKLSRLIVITSGWTASASELIINGLRPYMDVVLVGTTTYGKNVGSITISDPDGKIEWGLQPIIVKIFNKQMESDYTFGFTPDYTVEDKDKMIYPLGDLREKLLRSAVEDVCGLYLQNLAPLKKSIINSDREVANSISKNIDAFTINVDWTK